MSLSLLKTGTHVLVSLRSAEIHEWDLEAKKLVKSYRGHSVGKYILRASYGGLSQSFVVSGSQDGRVYVWNRETTNLLAVLKGHTAPVNVISWPSESPFMFASASDDHTVRVYIFLLFASMIFNRWY